MEAIKIKTLKYKPQKFAWKKSTGDIKMIQNKIT